MLKASTSGPEPSRATEKRPASAMELAATFTAKAQERPVPTPFLSGIGALGLSITYAQRCTQRDIDQSSACKTAVPKRLCPIPLHSFRRLW